MSIGQNAYSVWTEKKQVDACMISYLMFDWIEFCVNSTWLEKLIYASLRQSWGGKVISLPVSVVVWFEVQGRI